jgi:putative two-component system response regulator
VKDKKMKILVVDDNRTNLRLLVAMIDKLRNCQAIPFSSPADALSAMPDLDFDVAILDYRMPVYNGVELLTEMMHFSKYTSVPIIFVTADPDQATRMAALNAGAIDFLQKPIEFQEFKARVQNIAALADVRRQHALQIEQLQAISSQLMEAESREHAMDRSAIALRESEREIIHRITLAAGYKDQANALHGQRVAAYAAAIARAFGLDDGLVNDIRLTAPMFDMDMVLASDTAMLKQGKLTEAGYRNRPSRSAASNDKSLAPSSLLRLAKEIASSYRERWDGQGYPNRLKGENIPLPGRIISVAAVLDALTSDRPFKAAWTLPRAIEHIVRKSGSQFDPACVVALEAARDEIHSIASTETLPMGLSSAS